MSILKPGHVIAGFTVDTLIKDGVYNVTYRITSGDGEACFMKLYDPNRMPASVRSSEGDVIEIKLCRGLDSPNVIRYICDGVYQHDGNAYPYIITNYFSGRLLSELVFQEQPMSAGEAVAIYREMLAGLSYLHEHGLVHNDITPRNVMYDPESGRVQLIDMGHVAHAGTSEHHYLQDDMTPFFRSPESYRGLNDPAGDVFSATAVLYALLTGRAPWERDLTVDEDHPLKTAIHMARKSHLDLDSLTIEPWLADVLRGGLAVKTAERLSIDILVNAIDKGRSPYEKDDKKDAGTDDRDSDKFVDKGTDRPGVKRQKTAESTNTPKDDTAVKRGNGFADVAGMDELKELLQKKVLFILKDKEKAERYRLTPPNGMLLYGPPGCGKSYFAEKFAEESGFNYKFVKASDLGSIYVHGGQGKIAELFDKARQKSPVIICFDEFDAMVPDRTSRSAEHISGEVNEFLSQLNNCSKDGIFVIGTTNRPDLIDPAVLRKGRVDISVYIPAPDVVTRKLMFDLYLKDRPCDKIDTQQLAEMTDKYVASDIAFIVNDAAMIAAFRDEPITQEGLINSVKTTRPSLTESMLADYERTRQKLENTTGAEPRPRVGFVQYS
ncbi:MAG: AAA family ATPase [Bacteroidales bacterium]|nr:AAA family ATPase [Bacteroidales bacterium]